MFGLIEVCIEFRLRFGCVLIEVWVIGVWIEFGLWFD